MSRALHSASQPASIPYSLYFAVASESGCGGIRVVTENGKILRESFGEHFKLYEIF
jgi:hypothetical protein